jgi:hypothetical protein
MTLNRREFLQMAVAMGPRWLGAVWPELRVPAGMSGATFFRKASRPAIPIRAASSSGPGGRTGRAAGVCSRWRLPRMMRSGGSSPRR